jgi:hypothetical protein
MNRCADEQKPTYSIAELGKKWEFVSGWIMLQYDFRLVKYDHSARNDEKMGINYLTMKQLVKYCLKLKGGLNTQNVS